MTNDYTLYILMRTDIPSQTTGRAMAQASHAANAFIKEFGWDKNVKSWQKQTNQGFGTAIVLAADNEIIANVWKQLPMGALKDRVIDPDYVIPVPSEVIPYIDKNYKRHFTLSEDKRKAFFSRKEVTCAYVFGSKEELKPILGNLPLHP